MKNIWILFFLLLISLNNISLATAQNSPVDNLQNSLSQESFIHLHPVYGGTKCGSGWSRLVIADAFSFPGGMVSFSKACHRHDGCYSRHRNKALCDRQFYARLKHACRQMSASKSNALLQECLSYAKLYFSTAKVFGQFRFNN